MQPGNKGATLELCSGTGVFSKVAKEEGCYPNIKLDINGGPNDVCIGILALDHTPTHKCNIVAVAAATNQLFLSSRSTHIMAKKNRTMVHGSWAVRVVSMSKKRQN